MKKTARVVKSKLSDWISVNVVTVEVQAKEAIGALYGWCGRGTSGVLDLIAEHNAEIDPKHFADDIRVLRAAAKELRKLEKTRI